MRCSFNDIYRIGAELGTEAGTNIVMVATQVGWENLVFVELLDASGGISGDEECRLSRSTSSLKPESKLDTVFTQSVLVRSQDTI